MTSVAESGSALHGRATDTGGAPVAWRTRAMGGLNQWLDWRMIDEAAARAWMADESFLSGKREVEALYVGPADVPPKSLRDAIAAITDPPVFTDRFIGNRRQDAGWAERRAKRIREAREMADAILALVREHAAQPSPNSVVAPPLTEEQRAYLEPLLRREPVDMSVVIGGPKAPR